MAQQQPRYHYQALAHGDQSTRDAIYHRMAREGLLPSAMSAYLHPTLADWRRVSDPARCWTLVCTDAHGDLLGVALMTPWRWRVWEFDFTAFRCAFPQAIDMARGAFAWMFANAPCDSIIGLCPLPNRHAWRLAEAAGFRVLGRIPGACKWARGNKTVPGVLVCATPESFTHPKEV